MLKTSKKLFVLVLVLLISVGILYLFSKDKPHVEMMNVETTGQTTDSANKKNAEEPMTGDVMNNNHYQEYTKSVFLNTASTQRILFFYANWCPTCRPADANFKANANKIPKNVTLLRVNYNDTDTDQDEKGLAETYGITYQHTFVQIDENGNVVMKWNGGQIDELLSHIKNI